MYATTADYEIGARAEGPPEKPWPTSCLRGPSLRQEAFLRPSYIGARWAGAVERRIRNSVAHGGLDAGAIDGLTAQHAQRFLHLTSDLLEVEPYLSTALSADLVMDFRTTRGLVTVIVGRFQISILAVGPSTLPIREHIDTSKFDDVRAKVQSVLGALRAQDNGALATRS